jgi:hypothetical protein
MNPKASFGNRFRSKLRGIKYLLMRYNSTNKLLLATLLKFESHYPPLRGIVQLTIFSALCFLILGFIIIVPLSFARGIIRLTLQTSSRLVGIRFQRVSLNWSFNNKRSSDINCSANKNWCRTGWERLRPSIGSSAWLFVRRIL